MRKYPLDETIFDAIDTKEKAYFIGFLLADGSINEKGGAISFSLQHRDIEILENFKSWFGWLQPITIRNLKDKQYVLLRIYSVSLCRALKRIGIGPNKTKSPSYPIISDNLFWSFLKGWSDGDGCIYLKGKRSSWGLILHESLIAPLKEQIDRRTGIHLCMQPHWRTSYIKTISINGNKNVCAFLSYLYGDEGGLTRKRNKYLMLVDYYRQMRMARSHPKGCYVAPSGRYIAEIKHLNKKIYIGTFDTIEGASDAYDEKAYALKGRRAQLNNPEQFMVKYGE